MDPEQFGEEEDGNDYNINYQNDQEQQNYQDYNDNYYGPEKQTGPYEVLPQSSLESQVRELVEQTMTTVALPFGWSMLLLREFKWQTDRIGEYFMNMDKYMQEIGYSPDLMTPDQAKTLNKIGSCDVCLQSEKDLIYNICGDFFCRTCWSNHIEESLNNLNPYTKCMSCKTPLLHETVKEILASPQFPGYLRIFSRYEKQICEFFTSTSKFYKCCPGVDCNYCIKCENFTITTVNCKCGKIFCFKCMNDDHSPCTCEERNRWLDIVMKQEANAKWIAQNTKLCPWCGKAVERSAGCNFMACICGKSFCYMCSKPWEPDHKDHFKCHIFRKKGDDQVSREKAVLEKMNFFAEKYLNTNAVVDALKKFDAFDKKKLLYEKLGIDLTQSDFIEQSYRLAIDCCQSLKWIYVYSYFVEIIDETKKISFEFSQGQYQSFKQQLLKKLSIDLKNFLINMQKALELNHGKFDEQTNQKQQFRQLFWDLKSKIINYSKFTNEFKGKFVAEIESIEPNLIRRGEEAKQEKVQEKKDKKDKKDRKERKA